MNAAGKKSTRVANAYKLLKWVQDMNCTNGFTPATFDMASIYDTFIGIDPYDVMEMTLKSRTILSEPRNRKFFTKFRRRWVLKLGKISTREVVPKHEMAAQALVPFPW